jgi:hypothetical protein
LAERGKRRRALRLRSVSLEERPGGLEVKGERKVLRDFGP